MKINAYRVRGSDWWKWWVSPAEVAIAMGSKKETTIGVHSLAVGVSLSDKADILGAVSDTVANLRSNLTVFAMNNLLMAVLYVTIALISIWPPFRTIGGGIPFYIILTLVTAGALSRLAAYFKVALRKRKFSAIIWATPTYFKGSGRMLAPLQARQEMVDVKPTKKWILSVVLVAVILNSVVWASPSRPAVVEGRIVYAPKFVSPGTSWEQRQVWTSSTLYVGFADSGEDAVWVVKIDYILKHTDLVQAPENWDAWFVTMVSNITNNVIQHVWDQNPHPSYSDEQKKADVVAAMSELTGDLEQHLKGLFIKEADGTVIWQLSVVVEEMPFSEYADVYRRQGK